MILLRAKVGQAPRLSVSLPARRSHRFGPRRSCQDSILLRKVRSKVRQFKLLTFVVADLAEGLLVLWNWE